jgi:hypothetical protein
LARRPRAPSIGDVSENAGRRETIYEVDIPPEHEGGIYANALFSWYTPYDFAPRLRRQAGVAGPADPADPVVIPCRVVARVRIPTMLAFHVIRTLNDRMTNYEEIYGEIRRPEGLDG